MQRALGLFSGVPNHLNNPISKDIHKEKGPQTFPCFNQMSFWILFLWLIWVPNPMIQRHGKTVHNNLFSTVLDSLIPCILTIQNIWCTNIYWFVYLFIFIYFIIYFIFKRKDKIKQFLFIIFFLNKRNKIKLNKPDYRK